MHVPCCFLASWLTTTCLDIYKIHPKLSTTNNPNPKICKQFRSPLNIRWTNNQHCLWGFWILAIIQTPMLNQVHKEGKSTIQEHSNSIKYHRQGVTMCNTLPTEQSLTTILQQQRSIAIVGVRQTSRAARPQHSSIPQSSYPVHWIKCSGDSNKTSNNPQLRLQCSLNNSCNAWIALSK